MTRVILTLLALLAWFAPMSGQSVTQAFYVYLNNAPLKPYFYADVDSISHSRIDLDSIERQEFVVTEIWTPDTVYRIPVETIDSIAFTTPEEKRKPGAIELSQEALDYLVKVDSLTLTFKSEIPDRLLPEVGNMLTYSASSKAMPYGFLGRVREVERGRGSDIMVSCDSIGVADAFDRLFLVGGYSSDQESLRRASRASGGSLEWTPIYLEPIEHVVDIPLGDLCEVSIPLAEDFSFGMSPPNIRFGMKYVPEAQYAIIKQEGSLETNTMVNVDGLLTATTDFEANANLSIDLATNLPEWMSIDKPLPIPYTFGLIHFEMNPEISMTGAMAIKTRRADHIELGFFMNYTDNPNLKSQVRIKKPKNYSRTWDTELYSAELDLFLGVYAGLYVGFDKPKDNKIRMLYGGVSAGFDVNHKFTIGHKDFLSATKETELYDRIVAEKVMTFEFQVKPKIGSSNDMLYDVFKEWEFGWPLMPSEERSVFPSFLQPKYVEDGEEAYIECNVYGEPYFDILPGIKVLDEKGDSIFAGYHSDMHRGGTTNYQLPYLHKVVNKKCIAYPSFKIFGREILASPGLPLELRAEPVTDDANPGANSADVAGHIEINANTNMNLEAGGYSVGFYYSTSSTGVHNGRRVSCSLRADRTFSTTLTGLDAETDYYYCAYITVNGETEYGETLHFVTSEAEEIDLGLSVNWRAWNVGASQPQQEGYHYAWAEIAKKDEYTWSTYFDNPYTSDSEWKGCDINLDIAGDPLYDPSTKLGTGWRMPTRDEMQELLDRCEWTWTQDAGVNGYRVVGPNGNSIFLPVTGLADGTSVSNPTSYGAYWTSTPQTDAQAKATASTLYFYGGTIKAQQWANRYGGRAVRPVKPK